MAGDLTDYGDRTNVLVMRSEKGGLHTYQDESEKQRAHHLRSLFRLAQ